MAARGIHIFQNDYALDIKTDFEEMLGAGLSIHEIESYLLDTAPEENDEEECMFWTTLAVLEWEYGVLHDDIKHKAKAVIKTNPDHMLFLNDKDKNKRKQELEKLYDILDTENPRVKKVRKVFIYRTSWKLGDIYALEINHTYVYFQIVGIQRRTKRIACLSNDAVYIKVFDVVSDDLLTIKAFHKKFFKLKYKKLDNSKGTNNYVEQLWCISEREKKDFEKSIIYIGNKKTRSIYTNEVSIFYQFKSLKNTLKNLFELD